MLMLRLAVLIMFCCACMVSGFTVARPGSLAGLEWRQNNGPSGTVAAASQLQQGKIVTCNLTGTRDYPLAIDAGQFVRIVVNRATVPLTLSILSPTGQRISATQIARANPFPISFLASSAGQYRMEIEPGTGEPVHYEIVLEAMRAAVDSDHGELDADQSFAQAEALRQSWNRNSLLQAVDQYKHALQYWKGAGNAQEQAILLNEIAGVLATVGQRQEAISDYQEADRLSEQSHYAQGRIEAMRRIAELVIDLNRLDEALKLADSAELLSEQTGDILGEERVFLIRGMAAYMSGDLVRAFDSLKQAKAKATEAGDSHGEAEVFLHTGYSYYDSGELANALKCQREALKIAKSRQFRDLEALALTAIGGSLCLLGEKQQAIDSHEDSLKLFQQIGDPFGQAVALNGLGYSHQDLGELEEAVDCFARARDLFASVNTRTFEALSLGYMARAYDRLERLAEARKYIDQKLDLSRQIVDRRMEFHSLQLSGEIYLEEKQPQKAIESFSKGLTLAEAVGDKRGQGLLLNKIGLVHEQAKDLPGARGCYAKALDLFEAAGDQGATVETLCNIASVELKKGNLADASSCLQKSIQMTELLRARVVDPRQRTSYFGTLQRAYRLYIDTLMRQSENDPSGNFAAAALEISERDRARSLNEILAESHINISRDVDPGLLERQQSIERDLNVLAEREMYLLAARQTTEQQEDLRQIDASIRDGRSNLESVEARIRETSPQYAALTQAKPLSLQAIKATLDPDSVLVEYSLGENQSYVWAVTRDGMVSGRLPSQRDLEQAVKGYLTSLTARERRQRQTPAEYSDRVTRADRLARSQGAELSRLLLGPVASVIGNRRVLIAADGVLQRVPFNALPAPEGGSDPLIAQHEVVYIPSATTISVLRAQLAKRPKPLKSLGILADPVFDPNDPRVTASRPGSGPSSVTAPDPMLRVALRDIGGEGDLIPRLKYTRAEAQALMKLVPPDDASVAMNFDASLQSVRSGIFSRARYVDFATHGVLDDRRPELSGLLLSMVDEHGRRLDGFLRLQDIYNLELSADMVSLSACQTGLGKDTAGEGMVGLTRGFLYAGAASVLTSLWEVDDEASASLMKSVYTKLLRENMRPSAALRAAQIELLRQKRWEAPFFWAAFALQGEWR